MAYQILWFLWGGLICHPLDIKEGWILLLHTTFRCVRNKVSSNQAQIYEEGCEEDVFTHNF